MDTATWNYPAITRGASHDRTMTMAIDGTPVNLTGYTARLHVRDRPTETGALILEMTQANGRLILGDTAGTIRRLLSADETADIAHGLYWYDLLLISSGGIADYLVRGRFPVKARVTI